MRRIKLTTPKFANEAEEAEWWDANRSMIEDDIRCELRRRISKYRLVGPILLMVALTSSGGAQMAAILYHSWLLWGLAIVAYSVLYVILTRHWV
jgi:hypothetical protein